jgi:hypothetical protein
METLCFAKSDFWMDRIPFMQVVSGITTAISLSVCPSDNLIALFPWTGLLGGPPFSLLLSISGP